MRKYELYLEAVKEMNSDEYQEIADILSRFMTLKSSNLNLNGTKSFQEEKVERLKNDMTKYEKDMKTEIMQLGNDMANMKTKLD